MILGRLRYPKGLYLRLMGRQIVTFLYKINTILGKDEKPYWDVAKEDLKRIYIKGTAGPIETVIVHLLNKARMPLSDWLAGKNDEGFRIVGFSCPGQKPGDDFSVAFFLNVL